MKKLTTILMLFVFLICTVGFMQTHTFPALDTNNIFTGTNTFNNDVTMSGSTTMSGSLNITSTTNPLTVGSCDKWIDSSQNIQTVLNTCPSGGTFRLEQGIFAQGLNHITLRSGQNIIGMGQFATVITCTGTGPCISGDGTTAASLTNIQIQIDTNPGARCLDWYNTAADSKWNMVYSVECQTTSGTKVIGQEGFGLRASTAFAMYWNYFIAVQTLNLDLGFHCTIVGAGPLTNNNSCNDNQFMGIQCSFFTNCLVFDKWANENRVFGITGSASGNLANSTLVTVGNGINPADNNMIYGIVSDTGTAGQAYQVLAGVSRTMIDGVVDAGGRVSTNASTTTVVKNFRNASSQADLYPNGSCAGGVGNPPIGQLAAPSSGLFWSGGGSPEICVLGFPVVSWVTTGTLLGNTMGYGWAAAADPNGTRTTNLGNPAPGIISADTTTVGNGLGSFEGRAFISVGTAAGLTGTGACATITTQTGGSSVGRATCTGTTGASTFIITPGITAPNGWVCEAFDQTTRANLLQQTATVAASCTLTATSVTQNDVIVFSARAF